MKTKNKENTILTQYLESRESIIKHVPKKNGKYRDGTQRWTLGNINGRSENDEVFPRNFQIKPENLLWSGKDWARIVFYAKTEKDDLKFEIFSKLFRTMNGTNASDMVFDFLDEAFDVIKKGKYLFFSIDGVRVFTCEFLGEREKEARKLDIEREAIVFDFYGKFFGLERIGIFNAENFLRRLNEYFDSNGKPYRVDIALDFPFGLDKILVNSNLGTPKKIYYGLNGEIETIYFGSKDDKEALIRIYNKKIKAQKDGEEIFYPYIFSNDEENEVWRLEVQLSSKMLKGITSDDLVDSSKIMGLMKGYLQSNKKYFDFDFLEYEKIPRVREVSISAKESYFVARMYKMWRSAKKNKCSTKKIKKLLEKKYFNEMIEKKH